MKILADENIGKKIIVYLRAKKGFNVVWIKESNRGMADEDIIKLAAKERSILLTYDSDFGSLVFLEQRPHFGVIFLRLSIDNPTLHTEALENFFLSHSKKEIMSGYWKIGDGYLISSNKQQAEV
jgi:predicted nuclease of predicted toxin-antitoxin system